MMLQERPCISSQQESLARSSNASKRSYETPSGLLLLRRCCQAELVEGLTVDEGLHAFARLPEREHALLHSLAANPQNMLTLAYTPGGKIVGQASLAPVDAWWQGIDKACEIAVEVSANWRGLGLAHQLLSLALEFEAVEESLILGLGFSWHWDYEGLGLTRFRYRELIERLFAAHGFVEYLTAEPNIRMDPANILLARLGSKITQEQLHRFYHRLLQSDTLPGM